MTSSRNWGFFYCKEFYMDNQYSFIEVKGSQDKRPKEIDVSPNHDYVIERKDIQKYEEKDENQNVLWTGWKYLERKIPKQQWTVEATAQNKENLDIILGALPDIYESLIAIQGLGV